MESGFSLPPGYAIDTAGTVEEAGKANSALAPIFPVMILLMLTVIMLQTRSFRMTALVFATAPLGLIGAAPALAIMGMPFGFNAILYFNAAEQDVNGCRHCIGEICLNVHQTQTPFLLLEIKGSSLDCLDSALEATGVQRNDEVITSTMTFAATAEVIRYFNAKPVLLDIDPNTFNINTDMIEASINPRTKAIFTSQASDTRRPASDSRHRQRAIAPITRIGSRKTP